MIYLFNLKVYHNEFHCDTVVNITQIWCQPAKTAVLLHSRPVWRFARRTSAIYCRKFHTDDVRVNFVNLHKLSFAVFVNRNQTFFNPSIHTTHEKFVPDRKFLTFSHMYELRQQLQTYREYFRNTGYWQLMRSTWRIETKLACQQLHLNHVVPERPMEE